MFMGLHYFILSIAIQSIFSQKLDLLIPYNNSYEVRLRTRQVQYCGGLADGETSFELYDIQEPQIVDRTVEVNSFVKKINYRIISGHVSVISDPLNSIKVLESAIDGCQTGYRTKVSTNAVINDCTVAINAGLFDTSTGYCHGNVVSNGIVVQNSSRITNAHFGITKDKNIFVGYLPTNFNLSDFEQLVGGVVWLVRNGTSFVNKSQQFECENSQESGTLKRFIEVQSARTAVGHDKYGNVLFFQVNGWTDHYGINLYELAELLISYGFVNAINLDGGGSSTFVVNGTLVNQPSDDCKDSKYKCERAVTTMICAKSLKMLRNKTSTTNVTDNYMLSKLENEQKNGILIGFTIQGTIIALGIFSIICLLTNIFSCIYMYKIKSYVEPTRRGNYSYIANILSNSDEDESDY